MARALWYINPGTAEIRSERLNLPRPGTVRVAARFSAISRGTERLIAHGNVPASEHDRMRAPYQTGEFSFPIKYGYSAIGHVTAGAEPLLNKRVFVLHPHQDIFHVRESDIVTVPDTVSDRRATLAANMETALNAHWDAGTAPGDQVVVVGAGMLGLLVAYLARRIAGVDVTIVDIDRARAQVAAALDVPFSLPGDAPRDARIVFHTSATEAGLQTAIDLAGFEGRIVELSWYGDRPVSLRLGGAFHSQRMQIIASQVGHVAPLKRAGTSRRARLETAMSLLDDERLDVLVAEDVSFPDIIRELPRIWAGQGLAPLIRYT